MVQKSVLHCIQYTVHFVVLGGVKMSMFSVNCIVCGALSLHLGGIMITAPP